MPLALYSNGVKKVDVISIERKNLPATFESIGQVEEKNDRSVIISFPLIREEITKESIQYPEGMNFLIEATLEDGTILTGRSKIDFTDDEKEAVIRTECPDPENKSHLGEFVPIKIKGAEYSNVITLPESALKQDWKGLFVFRVIPDGTNYTIKMIPVELGQWSCGCWTVLSGLECGEQIVAKEASILQDGFIVQPNFEKTSSRF